MKMKWALSAAVLASLTLPASAAKEDTPRVQAIWSAALDRMNQQNDYWFDAGDFPRTIQALRLMNVTYPDDYEVATNLGWLLESTEQWDEALVVYIRYGKENPGDPDSAYPEANFYFMKKAYAKVPPILEPTIVKKPHANSFRLLAHSYEKLGMLKDAARVWHSYIEIVPSDGAAKVNLQRVENKMKGENPPPPSKR
jgi:tetratricopeptide (TPR) repeat protein